MVAIPDVNIKQESATGPAAVTVKQHQGPAQLVLHGSWFCPFVQRVWIVLQEKGLPYEWKEINPYKKDKEYLAINPKGLVPALTHQGRNLNESTVIMEYLEDITSEDKAMHPHDPLDRAFARLWMDHIAKKIVPNFFGVLQAQEPEKQKEVQKKLTDGITELVGAMDPKGPFFFGNFFSMVDAMLVPWLVRHPAAFKRFKGYDLPTSGSPAWDRWSQWVQATTSRKSVVETTSDTEHYLHILSKYANDTAMSEAAQATRAGRVFY